MMQWLQRSLLFVENTDECSLAPEERPENINIAIANTGRSSGACKYWLVYLQTGCSSGAVILLKYRHRPFKITLLAVVICHCDEININTLLNIRTFIGAVPSMWVSGDSPFIQRG